MFTKQDNCTLYVHMSSVNTNTTSQAVHTISVLPFKTIKNGFAVSIKSRDYKAMGEFFQMLNSRQPTGSCP